MSSREEYEKAWKGLAGRLPAVGLEAETILADLCIVTNRYVTTLEAERDRWRDLFGQSAKNAEFWMNERDELKKQLEGALAMYDIRLKKFDDLKARLDEEGFVGE